MHLFKNVNNKVYGQPFLKCLNHCDFLDTLQGVEQLSFFFFFSRFCSPLRPPTLFLVSVLLHGIYKEPYMELLTLQAF